jgi:hypothetical protein
MDNVNCILFIEIIQTFLHYIEGDSRRYETSSLTEFIEKKLQPRLEHHHYNMSKAAHTRPSRRLSRFSNQPIPWTLPEEHSNDQYFAAVSRTLGYLKQDPILKTMRPQILASPKSNSPVGVAVKKMVQLSPKPCMKSRGS